MTDKLAIQTLSKTYGRTTALDGIDLGVAAGERVALVGHNGAGKTTLIKLALGLIRPDAGTIRIDGHDPAGRGSAELRRQTGFLPENVIFNGAATGRETLRFYARLKHAPKAQAGTLLDSLGLGDAADRRVATYSKGMRQRLGLAQVLLGAPRLLLLDEPTSGLDPVLRRDFYDLIDGLAHDGTTILLSSHALTELAMRTDRVAILKHGRLAAIGNVRDLARHARLPVRIRVQVPSGTAAAIGERLGQTADLHRVNDRHVELVCPAADKMAMLRRLTDLGGDVVDIEVDPPSLEDIYATFQDEEAR
jgi:Cu-processing system ATP-binding protein